MPVPKFLDFGINGVDLWRSEEMQLVQLMIPAESAHDTIAALGEVGLLAFKDLNADKSAFQRTYANQVKRCDEMARKLRFFHEQVEKAGLTVGLRPMPEKTIDLDELEAKLEEYEAEMLEVNANTERLQRSYAELVELQLVLEKAGAFFDQARSQASQEGFERSYSMPETMDAPLLESAQPVDSSKSARLGFVAGLIQTEKLVAFERLLFRATRGNMFLRQSPVGKVKDPASGEMLEKSVFVVFYAGERARTKILKICEAFGANRYPFPEDPTRQRQMHAEVTARLRELHTTLEAGERHREAFLQNIAFALDHWTTLVRREKAIYHTLNKLSIDVTSKVLVAEAWCPLAAKARVHEALRQAAEQSSTVQVGTILQPLVTHDPPPTYFRTTKFTACFQMIVEAYGIARYREVNPAVFSIVTFPFLFAVMFGDIGHGCLMLAFALYLLINERKFMKQQLDEIFGMAFGGRYCILLMGIFSIYTGLIYNEFFSMPTVIFGHTHARCMVGNKILTAVTDMRECKEHAGAEVAFPKHTTPYPLGVDPIWHGTKAELPFFNSMKMKMSILLGVCHMNLGIIMSLFNNLYFRDTLSTWCEFVPQMVFLNSLFGYLCSIIVHKWRTGSLADLYHVMIYMFLKPGNVDEAGYLFPGQAGLQVFLVLIAFAAVPCMLLPKPLILKKRHQQAAKGRSTYGVLGHDEGDEEERLPITGGHSSAPAASGGGHGGGGHGHGDHFDFGEIMVHQMIHTIEFVLGAVSNTASYLRLWALSLAHSQLSAVFYDRVLMMTISKNSAAMMFVGFFVWFIATMGVLMVMESLSAFLHALRLHWVEFMNKFYRGDGYAFTPFSFEVKEE